MKMPFFLVLIIIFFHAAAKLCTNPSSVQLDLAAYKIPKTNSYKFAFEIRNEQVGLNKNATGIAFVGNFSTLVLKNQQGTEFVYDSLEFGF
jgi:hypothetical protein